MATDDDDRFEPYEELARYASALDEMSRPAFFASPFYELLSGALIWSDEQRKTPVKGVWALRFIWAYRTSLMLNQLREELAEFWNFGLEHFPNWVGFRPERRTATPALLRIYREGNVKMRKCLRDLERGENAKIEGT